MPTGQLAERGLFSSFGSGVRSSGPKGGKMKVMAFQEWVSPGLTGTPEIVTSVSRGQGGVMECQRHTPWGGSPS